MTARELVIAEILERWDELTNPLRGPNGVRGDGTSTIGMPLTYTKDVREVERLYKLMRVTEGVYGQPAHPVVSLHWHLAEWYLRGSVTISYLPRFTKRHGKKVMLLNADRSPQLFPVRVTHRHPGVQETLAHTGVSWMAQSWRLSREPFLPGRS